MIYFRRCPRCSRRRPTLSGYCHSCGTPLDFAKGHASGRRRAARAAAAIALFAAPGAVAVGTADRYMPAVADWYTRLAVEHLPDSALRLAPITDDERAYYVCARSVVKRMDGEGTIATFASSEMATTQELGDGRRIIESYVVESVESGVSQQVVFRCTLREDESGWVIETVELERDEAEAPFFAARAD